MQIIGTTIDDDAAGGPSTKCAKVMGLPYPGGPVIDKLAGGRPKAFTFARPHVRGRVRLLVLGPQDVVPLHAARR